MTDPETDEMPGTESNDIDISKLPTDRIITELEKVMLMSEKPSLFFEELRRTGKLDRWFPEVKALIDVPQNFDYHKEGDVWTHTMLVLDEAAKRRDRVKYPFGFMMSALCHDLGKAVCTTVSEDGKVHSYEHEKTGLPVIRKFLERITSDTRLIGYVLNMSELHMEPNIMANARSRLKRTNKLFDSAAEPYDLIQLAVCDSLGKIPQCGDTEEFLMQRYKDFIEIMERPYLTERDLIKAGLEPSEDFDEILRYAHKLRLAGLDKNDQLRQSLAYARTLMKGNGRQYDPLAKDDPDISIPVKKMKKGGLGIFMVKQSMDDIRYEYADGKNILTIKKNLT